jgi:hypothetical protein
LCKTSKKKRSKHMIYMAVLQEVELFFY